MKPLNTILLLAALSAASSHAGETVSSSAYSGGSVSPPPFESLYNAGEWQVDLFGTWAFSSSDNDRLIDDSDDVFGGGLGFNYFITRNFGIGAEATLFDTEGDLLGTSALNLVLRLPVGNTGFAPYIYGGAGLTFNADDLDSDDFRDARDRVEDDDEPRDSDDVIFLAHAGAGVEYRFTSHFSLFADGRYTWSEKNDGDFGQVRTGVKFTF